MKFLKRLTKWLFKPIKSRQPQRKQTIRIVLARDIQRKLKRNPYWCGGKRGYPFKQTYHRYDLKPEINGKPVRLWLQVYIGDDMDCDEFIPIYYKKKRKRGKIKHRKTKS